MSDPTSMPTPSEASATGRNGAPLSGLRSQIYALLADAFSYPARGWRGRLLSRAARAERALDGESLPDDVRGYAPLLAGLREPLRRTPIEGCVRSHVGLFGHSSGGPCSPYEIEYGPDSEVIPPNRLADVVSFYRSFGLSIAETAAERADHVSIECEFMHFLTYKESLARQGLQAGRVGLVFNAERVFLEEHLGRFLPALALKVRRSDPDPLYRAVVELADRFVRDECARVGADPRKGFLAPREHRPPTDEDLCVSCEAAPQCGSKRPSESAV